MSVADTGNTSTDGSEKGCRRGGAGNEDKADDKQPAGEAEAAE